MAVGIGLEMGDAKKNVGRITGTCSYVSLFIDYNAEACDVTQDYIYRQSILISLGRFDYQTKMHEALQQMLSIASYLLSLPCRT
jgi:hypothetical protein